ncbi:MAG: carboxymuconolactone decarboxylase family protein [Hyphomicrobiales bacterium]|nr:carboxymuconolactone decarboxylase family protein [Hyphomicrobiales bacterium]
MSETTQRIPCYEPGGGLAESDQALADMSKMFNGRIPNFHKVLANSPAAVTAFEAMRRTLQRTKLRAAEREIISLEVSRRNACEYCLAAHAKFLRMMKTPEDQIEAAVSGTPMSNPRHALIQRVAQRLIDSQGRITDQELQDFREAGLSDGELIEIVAIIGWYTQATITNNLARTVVDPFWTE